MQKTFNFRSFISINTFLFFIMMVLSGAAAYIKPEGSVASWHSWSLWGLDKGGWEELHTLTGIFFLFFSLIHIVLNWKMLCQYLKQRKFFSYELVMSFLVLFFVSGSSILHIPPLSLLMDAGDHLSDSWADSGTPPFDRAERLTLQELCEHPEVGIKVEIALQRLEHSGITTANADSTLENLAGESGKSPAELYQIIRD